MVSFDTASEDLENEIGIRHDGVDRFEQVFELSLRRFLENLSDDISVETLENTPHRFLKALKEQTDGYGQDPVKLLSKTFVSDCDDLVVIRDIPFNSLCMHHGMPFWGQVDIGYIPNGKIAGLSKFPRAVQALAHRLQVQEHLTMQIRCAIDVALEPLGVGVRVNAIHSCMKCRGVKSTGRMITSCLSGVLRSVDAARAEFFSLLEG